MYIFRYKLYEVGHKSFIWYFQRQNIIKICLEEKCIYFFKLFEQQKNTIRKALVFDKGLKVLIKFHRYLIINNFFKNRIFNLYSCNFYSMRLSRVQLYFLKLSNEKNIPPDHLRSSILQQSRSLYFNVVSLDNLIHFQILISICDLTGFYVTI